MSPATEPVLSVVAPLRDGADFIATSLAGMVEVFDASGLSFEIVVVCDGSNSETVAAARGFEDPRVRVVDYPINLGKGSAIVIGVQHCRGRLVGWLDADLDVHPQAIVDAAGRFAADPVDAVVGSKRHPDSFVDYPLTRRFFSWGFQLLVRILFRIDVRDTQVGAKVFRREMLEVVAPLLLVKRYAFDLEVLAVGAEFGFDRVREVPITLDYRFTGTGVNWQAVNRMLVDTLAIAYRIYIRHHYVRRFAANQRVRLDEAMVTRPEVRA